MYYGRFTFTTEPFVHAYCGDLATAKYYNDELIGFTTRPAWDNEDDDATLFVESDDYNLVNTTGTLRVRRFLVQYPQVYAEKILTVNIVDPCLIPSALNGQNRNDRITPPQGYAFDNSIIRWSQDPPLEAVPAICPIRYECIPFSNSDLIN